MSRFYYHLRKKAVSTPSTNLGLVGNLLMAFLIVILVSFSLNFLERAIIDAKKFQVQKQEIKAGVAQNEPQLWPADKKLYLANLS